MTKVAASTANSLYELIGTNGAGDLDRVFVLAV